MANTEMTDNTAEVLAALSRASARALEIIGGKAESYAKGLAPVDTGALRNSITHKAEGGTMIVGSNVEYAPYIELGTGKEYSPPPEWIENNAKRGRGLDKWYYKDKLTGEWRVGLPQKPRPFLRPAIEDHVQEYKAIAEAELKKG